MRRTLLILGTLALVISILITVLRLSLSGSAVAEVFPVEPVAWQPPVPIVRPTKVATPSPGSQALPMQVTLQQGVDGYDGCSDTFLEYYRPDDSFCHDPELYLRANNKASVVVRYDLTKLPSNAIGLDNSANILKATLSFFVVQGRKDTVIGLYRLRRYWDACSVTWKAPWAKAGADGPEDRDLAAWSELTTSKAAGWLEWDVTELVQEWLRDPSSNIGLMMKSFELRWPAHLVIFSADHPALGSRPKLTIKYEVRPRTPTPIPPTPTATALPEPIASPTAVLTAAPTTIPTGLPTATPAPALPDRVLELRWHPRMNIGNAYGITAVFRTSGAGSKLAPVDLPYELSVAGHLTAPSFSVVDSSETNQVLRDANSGLSWSWTITPRLEGSQPVSLDLLFAWSTADAGGAEPGVWYRTKIALVDRPLATWAQIDMARNLLALFGVACLAGWALLRRRA